MHIKDFSFWPLKLHSQVLVVWIPLVPVQTGNGALSVAIGSHNCPVGPMINLSTGIADRANTNRQPEFDSNVQDVLCLELNGGDAVIFHPNLYHMSHPNCTENLRIAWSSVWVHPDARWDPSRVPNHPRSKDVKQGCKVGHFEWGGSIK